MQQHDTCDTCNSIPAYSSLKRDNFGVNASICAHALHCSASGRKGLLGRKAGKIFVHVKEIVKQATLASPIGQEYSTLLRTHLLPVPHYCNTVSCDVFEGMSTSHHAAMRPPNITVHHTVRDWHTTSLTLARASQSSCSASRLCNEATLLHDGLSPYA